MHARTCVCSTYVRTNVRTYERTYACIGFAGPVVADVELLEQRQVRHVGDGVELVAGGGGAGEGPRINPN